MINLVIVIYKNKLSAVKLFPEIRIENVMEISYEIVVLFKFYLLVNDFS